MSGTSPGFPGEVFEFGALRSGRFRRLFFRAFDLPMKPAPHPPRFAETGAPAAGARAQGAQMFCVFRRRMGVFPVFSGNAFTPLCGRVFQDMA